MDFVNSFEIVYFVIVYLIIGCFTTVITNDSKVKPIFGLIDILFWPLVWALILIIILFTKVKQHVKKV